MSVFCFRLCLACPRYFLILGIRILMRLFLFFLILLNLSTCLRLPNHSFFYTSYLFVSRNDFQSHSNTISPVFRFIKIPRILDRFCSQYLISSPYLECWQLAICDSNLVMRYVNVSASCLTFPLDYSETHLLLSHPVATTSIVLKFFR